MKIDKSVLDSTSFNVYEVKLLVNEGYEIHYSKSYALFTNKENALLVKDILDKKNLSWFISDGLVDKGDLDVQILIVGRKVNNVDNLFKKLSIYKPE